MRLRLPAHEKTSRLPRGGSLPIHRKRQMDAQRPVLRNIRSALYQNPSCHVGVARSEPSGRAIEVMTAVTPAVATGPTSRSWSCCCRVFPRTIKRLSSRTSTRSGVRLTIESMRPAAVRSVICIAPHPVLSTPESRRVCVQDVGAGTTIGGTGRGSTGRAPGVESLPHAANRLTLRIKHRLEIRDAVRMGASRRKEEERSRHKGAHRDKSAYRPPRYLFQTDRWNPRVMYSADKSGAV